MDFFDSIGMAALGSRLRRLGDRLAEDAKPIYALYGTDLSPRWFPVISLLAQGREESITTIADEIGHTHVSVSQIVSEMAKGGYARLKKIKTDGRKTVVTLSAKGKAAARKLDVQCIDVAAAVAALPSQAGAALWAALEKAEAAFAREGLYQRVTREKIKRETGVTIVDYEPRFAKAFRTLNEQWIKAHFKLEDTDRRMLNDPAGSILRPGGHILVAVLNGKPVGTCALIPHGEQCLELAKMAVASSARGMGLGWLLGQAAIQKATAAGARKLFLESNTRLVPAINLYRKLGFVKISGEPSPYERCNIQMELRLRRAMEWGTP